MSDIVPQAQTLVAMLLSLMPTNYQRDNLQALLGLFLQARGYPLPQHSQTKSPSALSRFLNPNPWSTRQVIRSVRQQLLQWMLTHRPLGRRPHRQVILDLTCLEKSGKFKTALPGLVGVFHGKRGLQVVFLYLVVGVWRCPWGFRIYRGQGTATPVELALRLLCTLPKPLTTHFEVMVLADTAFGSIKFLKGVRRLGLHRLVGANKRRRLQDGRCLNDLAHHASQVRLQGWEQCVWLAWYWLRQSDGRVLKRFIVRTRRLKGSTLLWWGKRRWQIEGWFKVAKHRFGLHLANRLRWECIAGWC
jgi:hypothetical protein